MITVHFETVWEFKCLPLLLDLYLFLIAQAWSIHGLRVLSLPLRVCLFVWHCVAGSSAAGRWTAWPWRDKRTMAFRCHWTLSSCRPLGSWAGGQVSVPSLTTLSENTELISCSLLHLEVNKVNRPQGAISDFFLLYIYIYPGGLGWKMCGPFPEDLGNRKHKWTSGSRVEKHKPKFNEKLKCQDPFCMPSVLLKWKTSEHLLHLQRLQKNRCRAVWWICIGTPKVFK